MKDRSVEYPNRYQFNLVGGTDNIYDVIPAPGEITEEGTPINKGTLLSDATASKLGFASTDDPTVDDAFNAVPKLSQIRQTLPVAEGMTVQAGDVVDVVDGQVTKKTSVAEKAVDFSESLGTSSYYNNLCCLERSENEFVCFYYTGSAIKAVIAQNNAGEIVYKTPNTLLTVTMSSSSATQGLNAIELENNKWCVVYSEAGMGKSLKLFVVTYDADTDTFTAGSAYVPWQELQYTSLVRITSTQFAIGGSWDGSLYFIVFNVSGTTLTEVINTTHYSTSVSMHKLFPIDETHVLEMHISTSQVYTVVASVITISGATATYQNVGSVSIQSLLQIVQLDAFSYLAFNFTSSGTTEAIPLFVASDFSTGYVGTGQQVDSSQLDNNSSDFYSFYPKAESLGSNRYQIFTLNNSSQIVKFSIEMDSTAHSATITNPLSIAYTSNMSFAAIPVVVNGLYWYPARAGSNNQTLSVFTQYEKNGSVDAFALASGTASQNVDIAYDGVFDFDGLAVGRSVYDGNDALIAYCPVTGKVNVIGYWKRDDVNTIALGSYVGTGQYGANNPNTLTLPFNPTFIYIRNTLLLFQGEQSAGGFNSSQDALKVTWGDKTVSWYSTMNENEQRNAKGTSYAYVVVK